VLEFLEDAQGWISQLMFLKLSYCRDIEKLHEKISTKAKCIGHLKATMEKTQLEVIK
jgi:hypothetical protein